MTRRSSILFVPAASLHKLFPSHSKLQTRVPRQKCNRKTPPIIAAREWRTNTSSALDQDTLPDRYIDLHTMQTIRADNAHLSHEHHPDTSFGLFDIDTSLHDPAQYAQIRDLLFTEHTIPLSDPQKDAVQALLSSRSVIFNAPTAFEKLPVLIDLVLRSRLWKQHLVYCAQSTRAAEVAYAALCAQLGPERRNEVRLDLGVLQDSESTNPNRCRITITSPFVLRTALVDTDNAAWILQTDVLFVDTLTDWNMSEWEDIFLALPSQILLCVFTADLSSSDHQLLPLWIEAIQNAVVCVTPSKESSVLHRIENPPHFPLLRTFAYNAATHDSPVQVSLKFLTEMFKGKMSLSTVPKYSQCFLHGITMIPAEKPTDLLFSSAKEAQYADVAAILVAAAKASQNNSRKRKVKNSKRKERTASSRAAAKRRREAVYDSSLVFPAIVLVQGRAETGYAAAAVKSALGDGIVLLKEEDSQEYIEDIVTSMKSEKDGKLTDTDIYVLDMMLSGIGIIHDGCTPNIRLLVEELFRSGFIPLLTVDTYLGSSEISALPSVKTVLVDSSSLAVCDDAVKGLICSSAVTALAGRARKDDVGNLIVLWYDESAGDETMGYHLASTLLHRLFMKESKNSDEYRNGDLTRRAPTRNGQNSTEDVPQSKFASSYGGVLRSLRRFGTDGYSSIFEYSFDSHRGWLERAVIRATIEKVTVERDALSSRLEKEDWSSIADHERREAKISEVKRVLKAMGNRYDVVLEKRMLSELRVSVPGRIIGLMSSTRTDSNISWRYDLLSGSENVEKDTKKGMQAEGSNLATKDEELYKNELVVRAVFVALLDQDSDGQRIAGMESRFVVACILADGLWTLVPISAVVALTKKKKDIISNVDLLMMPHPATYDLEPESQWATCRPIDEGEQEAVWRIADEMVAKDASDERPRLEHFTIAEFDSQKSRLEVIESLHSQSPWYGKEDEIIAVRKLRRRKAMIKDELKLLQSRESCVEEELFQRHEKYRCSQQALMAVMEDCNAVTIQGEHSMEMTPIGALGSVLPCEYPIFAAACLCLIDEVGKLRPAQFAAFVALIVCPGENWDVTNMNAGGKQGGSVEEEEVAFDMSYVQKEDELEDEEGEAISYPGEIYGLPHTVTETVWEIHEALGQLHDRHMSEGEERISGVSEITPVELSGGFAEVVGSFADGGEWSSEGVQGMNEGNKVVREMQRVRKSLQIIAKNDTYGDIDSEVRCVAKSALEMMSRYPMTREESIMELVDGGLVEKQWTGSTYDKWWRGARDSIASVQVQIEEKKKLQLSSCGE